MSDTHASPDAGAVAPVPTVEVSDDMTEHQVAARIAERWRKQREPEAPVKAAEPPPQVKAPEAEPAPVEASGDTSAEPEADQPPIKAPNSWNAEEKERFSQLPRETQAYLAQREQERERHLSRRDNEAAEKLKVIEARERAAEQERQQYERANQATVQLIQDMQSREFPDIKSYDDARNLSVTDPTRYLQWRANQDVLEAKSRELAEQTSRQQAAYEKEWAEFSQKEDKKFIESFPEFKDAAKSSKMAEAVLKTWEDAGGSRDDLMMSYNGKVALTARSAALQGVLLKAALYDQAKANASKPAPKPVPPVQKPGVAQAPTNSADEEIKTLTKRVAQTGSFKDMQALQLAKLRRGQN